MMLGPAASKPSFYAGKAAAKRVDKTALKVQGLPLLYSLGSWEGFCGV